MTTRKIDVNDAAVALGTVGNAAVRWWTSNRPVRMSRKKHLENPTINCATEQEKALAFAVSELLRRGW